jgi:hypothetical protein
MSSVIPGTSRVSQAAFSVLRSSLADRNPVARRKDSGGVSLAWNFPNIKKLAILRVKLLDS